jgi:hypothetical protein
MVRGGKKRKDGRRLRAALAYRMYSVTKPIIFVEGLVLVDQSERPLRVAPPRLPE